MIRNFLFLFLIGLFSLPGMAQTERLQQLTAEGKKAFVEFVDVRKNIPEAKAAVINILRSEEWNRWPLVDSVQKADFILKVFVEKKGLNPMSFSSDGARVRVRAEIYDPERHLLWKSQRYQGNATLFTGFGALDDAMRKLVRRALGKELSGIETEEE